MGNRHSVQYEIAQLHVTKFFKGTDITRPIQRERRNQFGIMILPKLNVLDLDDYLCFSEVRNYQHSIAPYERVLSIGEVDLIYVQLLPLEGSWMDEAIEYSDHEIAHIIESNFDDIAKSLEPIASNMKPHSYMPYQSVHLMSLWKSEVEVIEYDGDVDVEYGFGFAGIIHNADLVKLTAA